MKDPRFPDRCRRVLAAKGTLRLAAFGSSTTAGYGASDPAHSYPEVLRALLSPRMPNGIALFSHGISGESCEEMAGRVGAVLDDRPDLVIWQTGSNDAARPVPLDRFVALTAAGLDRFAAADLDLVLMDQQYSDALEAVPDLPRYRDALHRLAAVRGVPLFPRYAIMRGWCEHGRFDRTALSPDGTHMTDAGYAALAAAVADWLCARLEPASA
ncbi:MAG: SGNH/GDSL hydrolase family protein [Gluconacetobacter diazotrophicus]|nr:SGNH/GDSL hydrolase family protein [Gluconacetobacter diazotrophicus]